MRRNLLFLISFILVIGLAAGNQASAVTIYYDNFDGPAGTPLNGQLPDTRPGSEVWVAGPNDFDADGTITWDNVQYGDSAYLPFVPVSGYIYTLSATIQAVSGPTTPDSNWIGLGFTQSNLNPGSRFYSDNGDRNPIYWGMTRSNTANQNDQTFTGPGTGGGANTTTISADNLKIVLDTTFSPWVAYWYYNGNLERTANVADAQKSNFQYVAVCNCRISGSIDDFLLTRELGPRAANPGPASGATAVPREVVLSWTSGKDAVKHNVYFGASFNDVNNATTANPLGVLASQNQTTNTYDPPGLLEYNKIYYWRIDEVNSASIIWKGNVWSFTTAAQPGVISVYIYYDNFDGPAGTDLQGTTPDTTTGGATWVAGANFDADGTVTYPTGDTTMGDSVYLPFVPQNGYIYELSAKIDTRVSVPRGTSGYNDWIGLGFTQSNVNPGNRFYDDNGTRNPVYWGMTRTNMSASQDQTFTGAGTAGGVPTTTISADNVKIILDTTAATWVVQWYFNGVPQRTVNVDNALKPNFQYVAMTNARADGFIDDFTLIQYVPVQALHPNPANGIMVYTTDVTLQWRPGDYAATHKIYFGTSFNDVNNASLSVYKGEQNRDANSYPATGLTQGATYYWRIDEVNSSTTWRGDVWKFRVQPLTAYNPSPPEGAKYMDAGVDLAWSPGAKAKKHDVYLGTSFNNVNDANTANPLGVLLKQNNDANNYDPGILAFGTTYYWRIDEVNTPNIWKGNVWSFETMPSIPNPDDPTLMGWWKFDEGVGTKTLDWSGHGYHGTLINGPYWAAGHIGGALQFDGLNDQVSLPIGSLIGSLTNSTFAIWVNFTSVGGGAPTQRIFDFGTGSGTANYMYLTPRNEGGGPMQFIIMSSGGVQSLIAAPSMLAAGWHHVAVVINGVSQTVQLYLDGSVVASGPTQTLPSALGNTTGNWLGRSQTAAYNWLNGFLDDFRIYNRVLTQSEIEKLMAPPEAWDPNPPDNDTNVAPTLTLIWKPGSKAAKHDVYLSDNWDDVNEATTANTSTYPGVYIGKRIDSNNCTPPTLKLGQTYYWRVDEVNLLNIWRGDVWRFTVADYFLVDDFESYTNSDPNIIFKTWKDGVGYSPGNGTGSQAGYRDPNYAERNTLFIHGGIQAMPVDYNNLKLPYDSNVSRTFAAPQDWTLQGVKALSLWFRGYPASVGSFVESPAGVYTMTASGADIWNVPDLRRPSRFHDEFHYAYIQISGDCAIAARVESITNTNAWAKAGVMIRDSTDANSAHAMTCLTPSPANGISFQHRDIAGGPSTNDINIPNINPPYWIDLERKGDTFTAYYSSNGSNWYRLSSTTITMTDPVYIGLALTAHNTAATCTAVFSNVLGVTPPSPWPSQDIGIKSNVAAPLYVTLQDSGARTARVTNTDANAVLNPAWQAWDIALSDFADVNKTAITKLTIGVGNRSSPVGVGTIYVDDIRLYIPRCMPGTVPDSTSGDCLVDYQDLNILTNNWLISTWDVTPQNPGDVGLVAYYKFDGDFKNTPPDVTKDGEPNGATIITNPARGQVANFDGMNDYVRLPIGSVINSLTSSTFATWVNFSNAGGSFQRIFDFGNNTTVYMFLTPSTGTTGSMRFAITISGGAAAEQRLNAPSTLTRGWHHVAVTIDAGNDTSRLYLDGVQVAENTAATLTPSSLGNTTNNWLGRSQYAADAYLNGYLDDFRIYNRALSQGEVTWLAGKTSFTQPLYLLLTPRNPGINLYNDGTIDLRDYAVLAEKWLEELLWPQ